MDDCQTILTSSAVGTHIIGSAAAGMQAGIGNVAAGSVFAICQSAAAGGSAATMVNGVVQATAVTAQVVVGLVQANAGNAQRERQLRAEGKTGDDGNDEEKEEKGERLVF